MSEVPYIKPRPDRKAIKQALENALKAIHEDHELISIAWSFNAVDVHLTAPRAGSSWDMIGEYSDEVECYSFCHLSANVDGVKITVIESAENPKASGVYTRVDGEWVRA